jgi:acetoin:2,6-dichlorophenolindophenol oxidoreductase subunit beta
VSATYTLSQAFQEGVREEMHRDENIFILGTDLYIRGGHWGQVQGLGPEFGRDRVRDAPISEAAMMAAGVGSALNGMRPIVDLNFIDFVFGAMDELVNQAAKIRYMWGVPVPLVVRATAGVAYGGAQHNNSLEACFAHIPGLFVAMPATPTDTKGLIKTALRGEDPVIFLMHKMLTGVRGEVDGPDVLVPLGKGRICREGNDVTLVTYSITVKKGLEAAEEAAAKGIDVEVIDLRTVFPLDLALIQASVRKTNRLVVAGEAPRFGSVASEIAASIQEALFDDLDAPVRRVSGKHTPIPSSPPLIDVVIPQVADIERAILETVARGE